MRYLAAALVVIALLVACLLGDMGYVPDDADRSAWDGWATIALIGFGLLIWTKEPK